MDSVAEGRNADKNEKQTNKTKTNRFFQEPQKNSTTRNYNHTSSLSFLHVVWDRDRSLLYIYIIFLFDRFPRSLVIRSRRNKPKMRKSAGIS